MVKARQWQTQNIYGVTVLVGDVEEICRETPTDNTASDVRFQANNVRCMRYMLTRQGFKGPKATFPVLLMFGSIYWQFHIMFHMEHHNGSRNWVDVTICEVNCRTRSTRPGHWHWHQEGLLQLLPSSEQGIWQQWDTKG